MNNNNVNCQKCFPFEIYSFENIESETGLIHTIDKLIADGVIESLIDIDSTFDETIYTTVDNYKCKYCNEIWSHSTSVDYYRGFFLKHKNIKNKILIDKRKNTTAKIGCLIFVILLFFVIYFIIS